jgi:hypothetical protein
LPGYLPFAASLGGCLATVGANRCATGTVAVDPVAEPADCSVIWALVRLDALALMLLGWSDWDCGTCTLGGASCALE